MTFRVDHAVINVLTDMDAAVRLFSAMGFTLTARGYHSLGSINHLMMLGHDYLELVGIEPGANPVRREVADSPVGLNGLVFDTTDARQLHDDLAARDIPVLAPVDFDRPVEIDGQKDRAAFTTVRLAPAFLKGGRFYFCEHKTRHLVWRPEWQQHRNTAQALAGMTVVVPDPLAESVHHTRLLGVPPGQSTAHECEFDLSGFALRLCTLERYAARYGDAACKTYGAGDSFMAALAVRVASVEALRNCLAQSPVPITCLDHGDTITIAASSAFNCPIDFVSSEL